MIAITFNLNTINNATKWSLGKVNFLVLLRVVLNNFRDVFFSIGAGYQYLTFFLFVLIVFSFYILWLKTPKSTWIFIFSLIGVTVVALLLPDLLSGNQRSASSRYFIAAYLGVHLSLAHLFYIQLKAVNFWYRKFWQVIISFLLVLGSVSCILISQFDLLSNRDTYGNSRIVAQIINKYDHPFIITRIAGITPNYPNNVIGMLSLSNYLSSNTQFQFIADINKLDVSNNKQDIFLYGNNSDSIINALHTQYRPKLLFEDLDKNNISSEKLWYLEKVLKVPDQY
jgi:uncharacterized membrane protein